MIFREYRRLHVMPGRSSKMPVTSMIDESGVAINICDLKYNFQFER